MPQELDVGECTPDCRANFMTWTKSESEIEGCVSWKDPCPLRPPSDWTLSHNSLPSLCLLDALHARGWKGESKIVLHTPHSGLMFDNRKPLASKAYMRCLLFCDDLFAAGVLEFKSGRPQSFYQWLLRYKALHPADKSMQSLRQILATDKTTIDPYYHDTELALALPPRVQPSQVVDPDIAVVEPVVDACPAAGPESPATPEAIIVPVPLAPAAILDEDIAELPPAPPLEVFHDDVDRWPTHIEGIVLKRIGGRRSDGGGGVVHPRLSITCPCCCTISRSTQLLTEALGPSAVLCYLGAWAEQFGEMTPERHRAFRPNLAQMRSYKDRKLEP